MRSHYSRRGDPSVADESDEGPSRRCPSVLSSPPSREGGNMIGSDGRETYPVVWPRGAKAVQATDVAPRLSTLDGKTIGQLWDDLFRGDEIFPILEEEIARRFPGVRFVRYDTFGSTHGRDEQRVLAELPGTLKALQVDAVISGMAC